MSTLSKADRTALKTKVKDQLRYLDILRKVCEYFCQFQPALTSYIRVSLECMAYVQRVLKVDSEIPTILEDILEVYSSYTELSKIISHMTQLIRQEEANIIHNTGMLATTW